MGTQREGPLLELAQVGKTIGGRRILRDISFRFEQGGRHLLVGANGSGKTTLLKIISSLMRPTAGKVYYRGQEIEALDGLYLKEISLLSHQLNMYEELTGLENLEFFARLYRVDGPKKKAQELLEWVGLKFFAKERVKNYSQGMKQRLAVAISILHSPGVLLFDEPFAGLDLRGTEVLREMIAELLSPGEGLLILAAHDPQRGWGLADRYLFLERGELTSWGDRGKFEQEGIERRLRARRDVGVW